MKLHEEIHQILKYETSVLDPEDANGLARTVATLLPQVYRAAPDLLVALEALMEFWDNGSPVYPGSLVVKVARAALSEAKGEQP